VQSMFERWNDYVERSPKVDGEWIVADRSEEDEDNFYSARDMQSPSA